jgi:hypothetical protein
MLQQWQALFGELEIVQQNPQILNEEELSRFEAENNILLPTGYKEFCQTFGTGSFGNFIRIFCPDQDLVEYSNLSLEAIREEIESFPSGRPDRDSSFQSLLANSFVFGDDFGANIAVWDLRTYSVLDEGYDIYWIDIDASDEELYRVGRNFFEFVNNFCLGQDALDLLPQEKRPLTDSILQTFTQFSSA